MFIEKHDPLTQATRSGSRRWRRGRDFDRAAIGWRKAVRLLVYAMLVGLGGAAALAGVTLLLQPPAPVGTVPAALPPLAPQASTPRPPPPVAPASPAAAAPASAAAGGSPAGATIAPAPEVAALQAQIREATAAIAALRAQADLARQELAKTRRGGSASPAAAEVKRQAAIEPGQPRTLVSAPPPRMAPQAAATAWSDAERVVQALARPPVPPAQRPQAIAPPVAPPAITSPDDDAAPDPPPPLRATPPSFLGAAHPAVAAAARPRVVLHYRAGSNTGRQVASDIAQRLLFSDFAYADTRQADTMPPAPTVRYFHREDAAMADRLAALLGGLGVPLQVQDLSGFAAPPASGTLDVWLPG